MTRTCRPRRLTGTLGKRTNKSASLTFAAVSLVRLPSVLVRLLSNMSIRVATGGISGNEAQPPKAQILERPFNLPSIERSLPVIQLCNSFRISRG